MQALALKPALMLVLMMTMPPELVLDQKQVPSLPHAYVGINTRCGAEDRKGIGRDGKGTKAGVEEEI